MFGCVISIRVGREGSMPSLKEGGGDELVTPRELSLPKVIEGKRGAASLGFCNSSGLHLLGTKVNTVIENVLLRLDGNEMVTL